MLFFNRKVKKLRYDLLPLFFGGRELFDHCVKRLKADVEFLYKKCDKNVKKI